MKDKNNQLEANSKNKGSCYLNSIEAKVNLRSVTDLELT
jgi:hypothetical protein